MQVNSFISKENIEKALNVEPATGPDFDSFVEKYTRGLESYVPPEKGWRLPDTISREQSYPMRDALISSHLRGFVDAWLETGRSSDGSESPINRNLMRAYDSWLVVAEYLKRCPAQFICSADRPGFRLQVGEPKWDIGVRDFFESMDSEAKRLFTGLVVSDWSERLCKCRYTLCGRYFFLSKPILHPRKGGIFCSGRCQRLALATKCTDNKRRRCHLALVEYAAQQLRNRKVRPEWLDDTKRKDWLAKKITFYLQRECKNIELRAYRQVVTVNWVTHNQAKIERARIIPMPG
jgi:hypothetical protein